MDTKIECNDNETVESSKKREKGFESNQEGKYKHGGEENMAFGPFQCFCETLEVPIYKGLFLGWIQNKHLCRRRIVFISRLIWLRRLPARSTLELTP
jgi:hypothetical protein